MAPNTPSARPAFWSIFLASFLLLLALETCSATPAHPAAASSKTVKDSNLPAQTSGVLGLSRLIEPLRQTNWIYLDYLGTEHAVPGHTSYESKTLIYFRCTQPTKRIVLNVNPEWNLTQIVVQDYENGLELQVIKDIFFNSADETLIVDMDQVLKTGTSYEIRMMSGLHVIDADDRYGIQAFNSTNADTGETVITVGLTSSPDSKRRFVPSFDDPAFKIPYKWNIIVYYGTQYAPAVAMMNVPRTGVEHFCPQDEPASRSSRYFFTSPNMAFRATLLEIVPFSWYDESGLKPPTDCFSRIDQHYADSELLQRHLRQ